MSFCSIYFLIIVHGGTEKTKKPCLGKSIPLSRHLPQHAFSRCPSCSQDLFPHHQILKDGTREEMPMILWIQTPHLLGPPNTFRHFGLPTCSSFACLNSASQVLYMHNGNSERKNIIPATTFNTCLSHHCLLHLSQASWLNHDEWYVVEVVSEG